MSTLPIEDYLLEPERYELREPGAWARAHEPQVVRDLGQRHGNRLERAGCLDEPVARGLRLERICGRRDRQSGVPREQDTDARGELRMRVQTGARRRAAQRDLAEALERRADAVVPLPHLGRVAGELLTERHRHRVHQVRPAGLDDVVELRRLGLQRVREPLQRRHQVVRDLVERGEMDCRGKDVVRRLPHVHVVVGMDAVAREGGDHLVRVHVRGRP